MYVYKTDDLTRHKAQKYLKLEMCVHEKSKWEVVNGNCVKTVQGTGQVCWTKTDRALPEIR